MGLCGAGMDKRALGPIQHARIIHIGPEAPADVPGNGLVFPCEGCDEMGHRRLIQTLQPRKRLGRHQECAHIVAIVWRKPLADRRDARILQAHARDVLGIHERVVFAPIHGEHKPPFGRRLRGECFQQIRREHMIAHHEQEGALKLPHRRARGCAVAERPIGSLHRFHIQPELAAEALRCGLNPRSLITGGHDHALDARACKRPQGAFQKRHTQKWNQGLWKPLVGKTRAAAGSEDQRLMRSRHRRVRRFRWRAHRRG